MKLIVHFSTLSSDYAFNGQDEYVVQDNLEKYTFICWPEQKLNCRNTSSMMPTTPKELLLKLPEIVKIGNIITTVSEHVILYIQREVRLGNLRNSDVELWHHNENGKKLCPLDNNGDFSDDVYFPNGFFNERLQLMRP